MHPKVFFLFYNALIYYIMLKSYISGILFISVLLIAVHVLVVHVVSSIKYLRMSLVNNCDLF